MQKTRLKQYARLIARMGCNVQKGQDVFLEAELDQPEFVAMVTDELYKAGARKVVVNFTYQPLTKLHVRHRSVKTLSTVDSYEEARLQYMAEHFPCRLYLVSEDPDGLKGVNLSKMAKGRQGQYPIIKPYRDKIEGKHQWCIAAVPGAAWAKKMFPNLSKHQAMEKLWEAILATSRVDEDPIAAWENHNRDLKARCEYLNSLGIESLHYTASNGTDLTVGMIPQARFSGGSETLANGVSFNPNIPSEECFISPKRGVAEGIVYATKPLCYQGQLIENFYLRFEGGKAVEAKAEVNDALLQEMLNMDEGARYLGECALVPFNSPINETGLLFYNTLFDENAACHLAFGEAYPECIAGGGDMDKEALKAQGLNDSITHVDFMVGTADLSIVGTTHDGRELPVFAEGNFAL